MNINIVRAIVVIGLAGATYAFCRSTPPVAMGDQQGVIMNLPTQVGTFSGQDQDISESERVILPKDTEFARKVYKNFGGEQINAQIVLAGGEKRSIHRPEICLPAQGWNIKTGQAVPIKLDDGRVLDVMKLDISKPVEIQPGVRKELTTIFLYWFIGKNMTTPYHWLRLGHANWDRVVHNINHRWAYVIVSAPVLDGFTPGGKNYEETKEILERFVGELAPQIMTEEVKEHIHE